MKMCPHKVLSNMSGVSKRNSIISHYIFKCNLLKLHHLYSSVTYLFYHHKPECLIRLVSAIPVRYWFYFYNPFVYSLEKMT